MEKPIKTIVFSVIVLAATASAAYILNLLDQIVHGQLYHYDLKFSLDWAIPYWNLLRIIQILLAVVLVSTAVNVLFTIRKYLSVKEPSVKMMSSKKPAVTISSQRHAISASPRKVSPTVRTFEKRSIMPVARTPASAPAISVPDVSTAPPVSAPEPSSTSAPLSSEISGLIRCSHCRKAFTQPLQMLDFSGDRPRIVNICPFCNEIIATAPRQNGNEQEKRLQLKKNNSYQPRTTASQSTS